MSDLYIKPGDVAAVQLNNYLYPYYVRDVNNNYIAPFSEGTENFVEPDENGVIYLTQRLLDVVNNTALPAFVIIYVQGLYANAKDLNAAIAAGWIKL